MPFFELPPPDPQDPAEEIPAPPWAGPPDTVLGRALDIQVVLVQTASAAVLVRNLVAYPTGVEFVLEVRRRSSDLDLADALGPGGPRSGGLGPHVLRFGVGLADGSKATNLHHGRRRSADVRGPFLMPRAGSGDARRWAIGYWLWPLPPPGPLAFVAEWPVEEIGETRVEIDAAGIRDAAARAVTLWDGDAGGGAFRAFGPVARGED